MTPHPKGVFCLEGDWWSDLKRPSSVEPLLQIIDQQLSLKRPHIRRDIGTVEEFWFYIDKWTQKRYRGYPLLYLGFHGEQGVLQIGPGKRFSNQVTLDDLAERLRGKCHRRLIHLGACLALGVDTRRIRRLLRETGALAVSGYSKEVVWMESAAFELLVLTEMQYWTLTIQGAIAMRQRIREAAPGLARRLGFRMEVRSVE
jgi:hypothetical protein